MPFSIKPVIIFSQDFGSLMRWDDRLNTTLQQIVDEILGCIASISNQSFEIETLQQGHRLSTIVALACGQTQAQGISQTIHCNVDFATKAAPTSSQGLLTTFFGHLLHRDGHALLCCQSSHFPCRGHGQNDRAFVPKHPPYTIAQTVYKYYSSSRTPQAINAIVPHSDSSISPHPQTGGKFAHLCQYRHSGLLSRNPVSLSIVHRLISHLSSAHFTVTSQISTDPSIRPY